MPAASLPLRAPSRQGAELQLRGAALHKKGKLEDAIPTYVESLSYTTNRRARFVTYNNLANAYMTRAQKARAARRAAPLVHSRAALRFVRSVRSPPVRTARPCRGGARDAQDPLDAPNLRRQALEMWREALRIEEGESDRSLTAFNAGNLLLEIDELTGAIKMFQRVLDWVPSEESHLVPQAHTKIGIAMQRIGMKRRLNASPSRSTSRSPSRSLLQSRSAPVLPSQ